MKPRGAGKDSSRILDPEKVLELLPEGNIFVDAGCGPGSYCLHAAKKYRVVVGIDLWFEGLCILKNRANEWGLANIKIVLADLGENLPIISHSVDVVLMANVLHDIKAEGKEKRAVEEIRRILKKGGCFAVVEFHKKETPAGPPVNIRMSPEEVLNLMESMGLKHIGIKDVGNYHYLSLFTS